ncbi:hypothetical protein JG687_00016834 [Phytophthora cactorum]|uniref:RxLR effector protein n=1 Tax=Phytophthora cactorum TaxID=29920 RepID=A0A8T1TST7_9STRA|nr:hypothetical protein JG687_00016834 [Phytophthora cactorum]
MDDAQRGFAACSSTRGHKWCKAGDGRRSNQSKRPVRGAKDSDYDGVRSITKDGTITKHKAKVTMPEADQQTREDDDDSADEERTLAKLDRVVSDLSDDTAKAAAKLTRTKSLSSVTPDEELAAMQKVYKSMKDSYKPVFKNLATVEKLDPKQAAANWGIWDKLKTKTMDQLASDPLYLFWMKYKKFWNKEWNKA